MAQPAAYEVKTFLSNDASIPGSIAAYIATDAFNDGGVNVEASLSVGDDRAAAYLDFSVFETGQDLASAVADLTENLTAITRLKDILVNFEAAYAKALYDTANRLPVSA